MHYRRAVQRLRMLAQACQQTTSSTLDESLLREAYVFGEVLDGADSIELVEVAMVLDLPSEQVPWESQPNGTRWLVDVLRLDKGAYAYWWRSRHDPVWNHHIREPVRFWSLDGPDEDVLRALSERRFADLPRVVADPGEVRAQTAAALDTALARLRAVHANYWERDWRQENRGNHRYPENALWEAVAGYLDLLDAKTPPDDEPQ
ncbi:DUF7711 family protein [Actinophytocola glycyrrhizae]|uniref:DUF7711 domain-containing protein n=1 Tax=Actinophytocola glycyrrhizae TaxID=2044873 RepID=A0ABV9S107_9PSEU